MQKIGLGTAAIGRPHYINIRQEKTNESFDLASFKAKGKEVLESAYQQGIRYFDTAPGYGIAEEILLEWLQGKSDNEIEIATKWGYTYTANFDINAKLHEIKDHGIEKLIEQWEVSKAFLPNLSTYQIHSATFETGVLENETVLAKLFELKKKHGIRIGLTTTSDNQVDVLKKALDIKKEGKLLFDVFQVTYNILDQSLATIINTLKEENCRVVIKEALANGRVFPNEKLPHYKGMYEVLKGLASKYNVGIDAIALQFCTQTINPFIVLSGGSNEQQIGENLKTNSIELEEREIETLKGFGVNVQEYWLERKGLEWN